MNDRTDFQVGIIGGGPAGISAAVWCADLGISSILLEGKPGLGGQLAAIHNPIENYPGVHAANGRDLLQKMQVTIGRYAPLTRSSAEVTKIDLSTGWANVSGGPPVSAKFWFLATGVRRRTIGVSGEVDLAGKGVIESGSASRSEVRGSAVAIVGGGDAAVENAHILASEAKHVYLIHRGSELRARTELRAAALSHPNVEVLFGSEVQELHGQGHLSAVTVRSNGTDEKRTIAVDYFLVRIGVIPNSELVRDLVETDHDGYVLVDSACRTSSPQLFAIGDVANPAAPTIASAVGAGATAAKTVSAMLIGRQYARR